MGIIGEPWVIRSRWCRLLALAGSVALLAMGVTSAHAADVTPRYPCVWGNDGSLMCKDRQTGRVWRCQQFGSTWLCRLSFSRGEPAPGEQSELEFALDQNPGRIPARPSGAAASPSPSSQTTRACSASWQVAVPRSSTQALTLIVDYGDGNTETRSVSQGSGTETLSFAHLFAGYPSGEAYLQVFSIVQTGDSVGTETLHWEGSGGYDPEMPPTTQRAVLGGGELEG